MSRCAQSRHASLLQSCACTLVLILGIPATANALPDDRDQPIHITADKALRDETQGVTIYSGNVFLVQGSMELEADTLTIYHVSENADKVIAKGKPAKMRQQPEPDKGVVHAHGEVITYFRDEDRVLLETNARLEQDGSVVAGDSIEYFIAKQLITAQSDQTQKGNKVSVVIPPNAQHKEKDKDKDKEKDKESDSGATKSE